MALGMSCNGWMENVSGMSIDGARRLVAGAPCRARQAACSLIAFIGLLHSLSLSLVAVVAVSSSRSRSSFLISFLLSGAGTSVWGEEDDPPDVELLLLVLVVVLFVFVEFEVESGPGAGA